MRNFFKRRGQQQSPLRLYSPGGRRLSTADKKAVTAAYRKALDAEPRITVRLNGIVDGQPGARQAALGDRVLTRDDYRAAVVMEMRVEPDVRVVTADMRDVVRYAVELPSSDYTAGVTAMAKQLDAQDCKAVLWRNAWGSVGYKGINSAWRDPQSEQLFSVQFHTPESRAAKEQVHRIQDELRQLDDSTVDGFDWQAALVRRPDEAHRVGQALHERPGVVAFVAERRPVVREALPVLLRNWRDREGRVHEQAWLPREKQWEISWRQKDAWLGINDNAFEELDEQETLAVFETRQQQVAALDDSRSR